MYRIISKAIAIACYFICLLFVIHGNSQNNIANLKLEKNTIYIFSRGTKTKSGIIAEKFNIHDKKITHVGIGFLEHNVLKIYHVVDIDTMQTALVVSDLKSFINESVYYLSVWKCDNPVVDFKNLKKICKYYTSKKIYFDYSFSLNDNTTLYCSEFCERVLKETNSVTFNFKPRVLKLERFYQTVLERAELVYYPVDFFEDHPSFTKIFESEFTVTTD
ncbi:hypothetical protein [Flavobacterium sp. N1994]|uniref:hypothetical protein n=1 Tax=Flavobacterium sp. N1994 TaxID=2986827 RepID=UPI002221D895|nr:hypothetical protein [Flavobacterium sp. N1994]